MLTLQMLSGKGQATAPLRMSRKAIVMGTAALAMCRAARILQASAFYTEPREPATAASKMCIRAREAEGAATAPLPL